jgi:hypothetical protein
MARLQGTYSYHSFCPADGVGGDPVKLVPWTPAGELAVETDVNGKISGKLIFPPAIILDVEGAIIPGEFKMFPKLPVPDGFEVTGKGLGAEYIVRGFFVDDPKCLAGTVKVVKGDLAHQPDGTSGPCVLIQSNGDGSWLMRVLRFFGQV